MLDVNLKGIRIDISNYNNTDKGDLGEDLVCLEKIDRLTEVTGCSLVSISTEDHSLAIKFEWKEDDEITEDNFFHIPETATVIVSTTNQWVVFDLAKKQILRHEAAYWSPTIQRRDDVIIVEDDLKAESIDLHCSTIDSVAIDPPTESKEYQDRIEYDSPICGKQVLRLVR